VRASRLLSALLLLQTHGRMSARALAQALDVSVRTVYRDMTALHAAGVPVYAEGGPDGGYQLVDGFRTRLTGLTEDEARGLFLTGLPGPAAELGLGALVSAAELKLAAALPPSLLEGANRVRDRFHLDAPGWYTEGDASPHLGRVADALWQQHRIRVGYRRWKEPTDVRRTLDPLGLVLKAGIWYLVATAERGRSPRTYKVNQILDLEVTGERFARPSTFDLRGYWTGYLSDYRGRLHQGEAVVRFSPKALDRLSDLVSPEVRAAVESTGTPDSTGWVTATVPIESLIHAEGQFLRFGAEVEVLQPARLRSRLAATARGLADLYASGARSRHHGSNRP
jgi:predicted DNA-binding transcriptional regulator YafY